MKLFVDLDGVCVRFLESAFRVHKKEIPNVVNHPFWKDWGMNINDFWKVIDDDQEFWYNLEPTPWFDGLISIVEEYDPNFYILTAPAHHENCYWGKRRWVRKHFGASFTRDIICSDKHLIINGNPSHILIDDSEKHEGKINDGQMILFPSIQNRLSEHCNNPLPYLKKELEKKWDSM